MFNINNQFSHLNYRQLLNLKLNNSTQLVIRYNSNQQLMFNHLLHKLNMFNQHNNHNIRLILLIMYNLNKQLMNNMSHNKQLNILNKLLFNIELLKQLIKLQFNKHIHKIQFNMFNLHFKNNHKFKIRLNIYNLKMFHNIHKMLLMFKVNQQHNM